MNSIVAFSWCLFGVLQVVAHSRSVQQGARSLVRSDRLQSRPVDAFNELFTDQDVRTSGVEYEHLARLKRIGVRGSSVSTHVPSLPEFEKDVRMLNIENEKMNLTKPGNVKLLIGILVMGHENDYRMLHRQTWMKRPGVCTVDMSSNEHPRGDCRVYVTFVAGVQEKLDGAMKAEANAHHDLIQPGLYWPTRNNTTHLDYPPQPFRRSGDYIYLRDPAFSGDPTYDHYAAAKLKTVTWLRFAVDHFKWATHIASQDLDTFPFVDRILYDLGNPDTCCGKEALSIKPPQWSENHGGLYYGVPCGGPQGMIQGAFIGLSRSLVECIYGKSLLWTLNANLGVATGDQVIYEHLKRAASNGDCPAPWWLRSDQWKHPV